MPARRYRSTPYIPARDPLSGIPPSRHPFQFWVLVAISISGVANLIGTENTVIADLLPVLFLKVWAATMLVGGLGAMVAAFWHDRVTGLLLERACLSAVSLVLTVYGGAVFYLVRLEGSVAATLAVALGVAAAWRCVHVTRELRIVRTMIDRMNR